MRVEFHRVFTPVDHSSSIPLNLQIVFQVEKAVALGRLGDGAMLPAEAELGGEFGVARSTLRRAMAHLEDRGVVVRERGRGKGTRITQSNPITRTPGTFATLYEMISATARKPVTRVLTFERMEVDEALSEESDLPVGMPIVHLLRHRSANDQPIAVLENWIKAEHVRFSPDRLEEESMEALLRETGVRIRHADFEFRPSRAGAAAAFFGVDADTPVINEIRRVFDESEQYEYSHHYSHPRNEQVRGVATA